MRAARRERGPRLLIVGIDGAGWDLVEPWIAAGELPALAALRAAGRHGRARSTVPAATFPAWTSFATAAEPAEHGIFDFSLRQGYGMRFVSARDRCAPSIWQRLANAGLRVCVYNLPASFPPERLPGGVFLSGFDTPVTTAIDPSFVHPRSLHRELTHRFGPLVISDLNEARIGPDWHERALEVLTRDVRRRAAIALHLLERAPWDVFFVLFGESDTAGHHFWMFSDPSSPRHRPSRLADGLLRVYREIDRALGELIDRLAPHATTLVLSDHGMGGAGTRAASLNRFLEQAGLLRFAPRSAGSSVSEVARRAALQLLPARLQGWLVRGPGAAVARRLEAASRFAGVHWEGTAAFSEELNYFPSVWLNVAGRDPRGVVPAEDYDATVRRVIAALEGWRDPATGAAMVASARSRTELYGDAPAVERAPDVIVDLALESGYSTTLLRCGGRPGPAVWRLEEAEYQGAKGSGMNGTHRPYGIYCWNGEGIQPGVGPDVPLAQLGAEVLERFGLPRHVRPPASDARRRDLAASGSAPGEIYGAQESAVLESRLRALGYLE